MHVYVKNHFSAPFLPWISFQFIMQICSSNARNSTIYHWLNMQLHCKIKTRIEAEHQGYKWNSKRRKRKRCSRALCKFKEPSRNFHSLATSFSLKCRNQIHHPAFQLNIKTVPILTQLSHNIPTLHHETCKFRHQMVGQHACKNWTIQVMFIDAAKTKRKARPSTHVMNLTPPQTSILKRTNHSN